MGLLVTGAMIWSFGVTVRPYFWSKTPCTIVSSQRPVDGIEKTSKSNEPFVIRYRYEAGGMTRESDRFERGMKVTLNSQQIEKLLLRYEAGAASVCYVNPKNPEESVLRRAPLWPMLFILLPLIFVGVGAVGIMGVWRGDAWKRRAVTRVGNSKEFGTLGKVAFFGVFLLVGGILTYVVAIRPLQKYFAATAWPETPCTIVSSSVGSHRGNKGGTTYSIDITYKYQVKGREYQSDTVSIMSGSSSGRSGKQRVVERYPTGSSAVCYVNPEDPTDTLLRRELSPWLLIGLVPGLFLLVGVVGVGSTIRSSVRGALTRSSVPVLPGVSHVVSPPILPVATSVGGPAELKAQYSPLTKLAGAMLGALFWNGITGVFVWFAVDSILDGKPEWFLIVFITPFVLIGLLLIGLVGRMFLNLFNPRMKLTANSSSVLLGGKLEVNWMFTSSSDRIKRLTLALEGREEVTTGSGKNRSTRTDVFATLPFVDTTEPLQISRGHGSVEVPANQRPSDDEGSRRVIWVLKAAGEIPLYPDFEETYEVTVMAREVRQNRDDDEDFAD